jgi:hypothetical protein
MAAERKLLTAPADPADAGKLASHYISSGLGNITVLRHDDSTIFAFGEFKSEVASRHSPGWHGVIHHNRPKLHGSGIRHEKWRKANFGNA